MKGCFQQYLLLCCGMLALVSCKREMFDANAYQSIIEESFPVGDIDPNHTWNLTKTTTTTVTADVSTTEEVKYIRILNGNPYETKDVEILAETTAAKGDTKSLTYSVPQYQQQCYAAVVTAGGSYILKAFATDAQNVSFASGSVAPTTTLHKPIYQTYTYCYETTYPQPGDWDFNDLVLRIQKLPSTSDDELRLAVTLAAVGCTKQVAAAIHLLNYGYDDIESVTTEDGRTFDGSLSVKRTFINTADLLVRGLHDEAVVNLFEDAHYALSPRLSGPETGNVPLHYFYNTHRQPNGTNQLQIAPKKITYVIKLKNGRTFGDFTLENIDPFALEDFNSGKWEIHNFSHKGDMILHDFGTNETATSNMMTWSLLIPNASFRYPVEGQSLGLYQDGILTGAYMERGHSYGQWVNDHTSNLDWFLYPTTGLVY